MSLWVLVSFVLVVLLVTRMLTCRLFGGDTALADVMPLAVVLVLCATCLFAGLFSCLGQRVPGNVGVAALYTLVLMSSLAVMLCRRRFLASPKDNRKGPNGRLSSKSVLVQTMPYLGILVVVAVCALVQFGPSIQINFASTDPGTHFNLTMRTLETGQFPASHWFTYYVSARGIELLRPFLSEGMEYKAFIVMEVAYLWLNGCVFYSLARRLRPEGGRMVAVCLVLTLVYLLGYPLNVLAFGFSYLGMGTTLVLAYVAVLGGRKRTSLRQILLAALPLVSLVFCYSLFVPVLLLGTMFFAAMRNREIIARHKRAVIGVAVFASILSMGLVGVVVRSGVVSALSSPGYCYVNLYGDFVFAAPVAIFGLVLLWRMPGNGVGESVVGMTLATVFATVVALALYREGVFSAYYYYKFYYILWPCVLLCAIPGVAGLWESQFRFTIGYGALWMLVLVAAVSGVDGRLAAAHPDLNPSPSSSVLAGVYANNFDEIRSPRISDAEVELWLAAADTRQSSEEYIPLLGTNIDVYWYQAVTRQYYRSDTRRFYYWLYDETDWGNLYIERLQGVEYCAVLYSQELPASLADFLNGREIVFENEAGYICSLL